MTGWLSGVLLGCRWLHQIADVSHGDYDVMTLLLLLCIRLFAFLSLLITAIIVVCSTLHFHSGPDQCVNRYTLIEQQCFPPTLVSSTLSLSLKFIKHQAFPTTFSILHVRIFASNSTLCVCLNVHHQEHLSRLYRRHQWKEIIDNKHLIRKLLLLTSTSTLTVSYNGPSFDCSRNDDINFEICRSSSQSKPFIAESFLYRPLNPRCQPGFQLHSPMFACIVVVGVAVVMTQWAVGWT